MCRLFHNRQMERATTKSDKSTDVASGFSQSEMHYPLSLAMAPAPCITSLPWSCRAHLCSRHPWRCWRSIWRFPWNHQSSPISQGKCSEFWSRLCGQASSRRWSASISWVPSRVILSLFLQCWKCLVWLSWSKNLGLPKIILVNSLQTSKLHKDEFVSFDCW